MKQRRILSFLLCLTLLCSALLLPRVPVVQAAVGNYYMINGKSLCSETVEDFGLGENEAYVQALYQYVWGVPYTDDFSSSDNILKNMLYEERELNPDNLRRLVQRSSPGSVLRVENIEETGQSSDQGYTVFIVSFDSKGFTVFERTDERRETYYTWERFCGLYSYSTVRFLKWPNSYFASSFTRSETDYQKPNRVLYYDKESAFSGDDVRWVQQRLTDAGFAVSVDGYFGKNTETMVKEFQAEFALTVTGVVDSLTADLLETPLKVPEMPQLRLRHEADSHLSCGDILTVTWDKVEYADSYCVMLYNSAGKAVEVLDTVTGNEASFVVDKTGNYTVKAFAYNTRFQSDVATMAQRVRVHNTFTVRFVDDDGTLLNKQTVAYGMDAATPASPRKTGYSFIGWDMEYTNITKSMTITARYVKKAFTVTFCDAEGTVIGQPQQVLYGEAAVAPDMTSTEGFVGWNKDFSYIDASMTVTAVVVSSESGLPARVENASAQRESDSSGYGVEFTVCNQVSERIIGRVVVSLKTTAGKFLTMTESSAFVLEGGAQKNMSVFVPYGGAATVVEIYIVENYNDLVPISAVAVIDEIATDNSFTDWLPDEQAPTSYYSTTDYRAEYSYRTKAKKESTAPSLAGWTQYDSRISSYNYSGWSSWSASAIAGSELREVETKTENYVSGYQIRCWLTQAASSPYYRHYWDYNRGAERASYGVHVHNKDVSVSTWNSYVNIAPGGKSAGTYSGYNKAGQYGRYSSDGIIWYPYNTLYGQTTYYRYQDKTPVYTYSYYQWGEWSDWSTEPVTASEDVEVRTRQTRRYEVNDPTECNTGTTRTIVGAVDSALAGKEATLFIYKIDEASDYTNEYVGQTTIDEDGVYRFSFKLREEPSVETGDFTVTLGIEGANTVFLLTPIQAPRKEYTVQICDYDGELLRDENGELLPESVQTVKSGDSAVLPTVNPSRPGYIFAGWNYSNASIHEDTNITALYVPEEYTVVFIDWTRESFEMVTGFHYGDLLTTPSLNMDSAYTVETENGSETLGYWKGVTEGMTVTENMVITAEYADFLQIVTMDESVQSLADLQGKTIAVGEEASLSCAAAEEVLNFYGLDCTLEYMSAEMALTAMEQGEISACFFVDMAPCELLREKEIRLLPLSDACISALCEENPVYSRATIAASCYAQKAAVSTISVARNTYQVSFYDYDKNLISTQTVKYGEKAEIPQLKADKRFVFIAWDSYDFTNVTEDLAVTPLYCYTETAEAPKASVRSGVYADTQTVSLSTETEGAEIYYSVDGGPEKKYTGPLTVDSSTSLSCYATAPGFNPSEPVESYYVINESGASNSWKYPVEVCYGSEKVGTYLVGAGETIGSMIPDFAREGYHFEGFYTDASLKTPWSKDGDAVNSALVLYAKLTPKKYTVRFCLEDGTVLESQSIPYLGEATPPAVTVPDESQVFVGWDTDDYICVTEELTVRAIIRNRSEVACVSLDKSKLTMISGMSFDLTAEISPLDYENNTLVWKSGDITVATVDDKGTVTAVAPGTAEISVFLAGETTSIAKCLVTVRPNPSEDICLVPNSALQLNKQLLTGILPEQNTVEQVLAQINSQETAAYSAEGRLLQNEERMATGDTVVLLDQTGRVLDTVTVVVAGDVNADGRVNNKDAAMLLRYTVNKEQLTALPMLAADTNGDGHISVRDVSVLQQYLLGMETPLS